MFFKRGIFSEQLTAICVTFRLARLVAEHTNTETKLRERIVYLESKLSRFADMIDEDDDASVFGEEDERRHLLGRHVSIDDNGR